MAKEVKAQINGILLSDPCFDYISGAEKEKIYAEIVAGKSHLLKIFDDVDYMGAVITIEAHKIHIRECGGAFMRFRHALDNYTSSLAKISGRNVVSLCSREDVRQIAIKKHGFKVYDKDELQKVL